MQKERNSPGQCAGQTRAHESLIRRARKARNGPDPDTQASFGIFPDLTRPGWHKLLPDPDDIRTLSMMLTAIDTVRVRIPAGNRNAVHSHG